MNFRLAKKKDIVLDIVEKKNKHKKEKPLKMSDVFETKNSKVIYRPKNTMKQILNDTQKVKMEQLIKRHKEKM